MSSDSHSEPSPDVGQAIAAPQVASLAQVRPQKIPAGNFSRKQKINPNKRTLPPQNAQDVRPQKKQKIQELNGNSFYYLLDLSLHLTKQKVLPHFSQKSICCQHAQ